VGCIKHSIIHLIKCDICVGKESHIILMAPYLIEKTLISILFKLTDKAPVVSLAPHPISSTPLPLYSSLFVLGRLGFLQMSVTAADFT
jgi:hypothetical protein